MTEHLCQQAFQQWHSRWCFSTVKDDCHLNFIHYAVMFKNYFVIAWRNLYRKKAYSLINIMGLAVGIASALLIFLIIHYEFSYDDFQTKKDNTYRVVTTYTNYSNGEVTGHQSAAPVPLSNALRSDFPQLEQVAAIWNIGGAQIHIPIPGKDLADERRVKVTEGIFFVEPSLFSIFTYQWLAGDAKRLTEPNTVVINQTLAGKFFGNWKEALGQTIQMWSYRIPLQVVGVYKDLPQNTDLEVSMGASYSTFKNINGAWGMENDWQSISWSSECFILLPQATKADYFRKLLSQFVKKYYPVSSETDGQKTKTTLSLQPLRDMHLNEDFYTFKGDALTHKELWSLGCIGFFLLLVACINFVNLATAQSVTRAKEIGVRKVLGSSRLHLFSQFLQETALLSLVSLIAGYLLAQSALPYINNLIQKPLSLSVIQSPSIFLFLLLLCIVVTLLAGFYPGIVLSGFRPIQALKSKLTTTGTSGIFIRRGLVVFQFVIAQCLLISTIVVVQQMRFFRKQPLGFNQNAVAMVDLPSDSTDRTKFNYLKTKMLSVPGVTAASFCMTPPASWDMSYQPFYFNDEPEKKDFNIYLMAADTDYVKTFEIGMLAGRLPYANDTARELLVNETLVKKLGFTLPDEVLGKTILFDSVKLPIVGVMHDFSSQSLKEAIEPIALSTSLNARAILAVRINPSSMHTTMADMQRIFSAIYPTYIYDVHFVDEEVNQFYTSEVLASQLFTIAAALAIFISCLGLYGLVSFMAAQRTKEVGIRKVLGASVQSIVYLFSKEFTVLIGIAFLIAAPVGYYFMHQWLSGFYNHIKINWLVFAIAVFSSILVAWIAVGYKAIKAAIANPVKSLRTE